jgi:hypothetical protein
MGSQSNNDLGKQQQSQNLLTHQFYRSTSFNPRFDKNDISVGNGIVKGEKDLQFLIKMNKPENKI